MTCGGAASVGVTCGGAASGCVTGGGARLPPGGFPGWRARSLREDRRDAAKRMSVLARGRDDGPQRPDDGRRGSEGRVEGSTRGTLERRRRCGTLLMVYLYTLDATYTHPPSLAFIHGTAQVRCVRKVNG